VALGAVYRSGKPTADQMAELRSTGIRTIVSLETYMMDPDDADEEATAAAAAGIKFLRVPMSPLPFDPPTVQQVQAAVDLVSDTTLQPALVHCYHGSDRTGIVVGAYHIEHDGWSPARAIADMRLYGHSWMFYGWDDLLYEF
jgi:protein tyrosine/serine phosphatase